MSAEVDRNLLFGVFALQANLISRERLIERMQDWGNRKEVPLSQILVEQSDLRKDDVHRIEQQIEDTLGQNGGDVTQCLQTAAAEVGSESIHDLPTLAPGDLQEALARLATAASSDQTRTISRPVADGSPRHVRFADMNFHAEGGLGEVWKARDEELGREVALKRIKQRFSGDQESQLRFAWEAEITGNLEHPGIVPVYGFGRYADGRPYYAMRFIRGESLKHEIEEFFKTAIASPPQLSPRNQAFRRLLNSLIDSCNTIHFAHCAGVIHRDLKPANIMVGSFGETLVVDWGLAKKLDSPDPHTADELPSLRLRLSNLGESTATQMGSAMGTPAYMSPEQAAGKWDRVGAASDIYSLGASLYHLLTGETSIRTRSLPELLARVAQGDFPPPREVNPGVPKPLNAICLKAMALLPANRYATARELAEDLERWLADEEVSAYPENWSERLSRWVRRNTTKVYAIAGSTLVVVVATIAIAVAGRNAAIARANAAQEKAKGLTRLQQERTAVDEWVTGASQALNEYAGAQHAREEMLKKAVEHYQAFAAEQDLGDDVVLELARNYHRLGEVQRRRGATKPAKLAEAQASLRKAEELLKPLAAANSAAMAEWTQVRIRQALMLADDRKHDAALQRLAETREALTGEGDEIQEALAFCLINEGSLLLAARNLPTARERLEAAVKLCDRLVATMSSGSSLADSQSLHRRLRAQANAQTLLGHCLGQQGEMQPGRKYLELAVSTYRQLLEEDRPRGFLYLEELAATRLALGDVLRRQASYPAAQEQYRQAIANLNKLGETFTDVPRMRELVAAAHVNAAQLAFEQGDATEAHAQLRIAAPIVEEVRPHRHQTDDFKLTAMALLDIFAEVLRDSKNDPDQLAEGVAACEEVQDVAATVSPALAQEAGERVAITLSHKAQLLERQGDDAAAEKHYLSSLAGLQKVAAASRTAQHAQALVHSYLGDLLARTDRAEKAAAEYQQAITLWTTLAAEAEPSPVILDRLAWLLANCQDSSQRDLQLAQRYSQQALQQAPTDPGFTCTVAAVHLRQGQYDKCVALLDSLHQSPDELGGYAGHVLVLQALCRWEQNRQDEAKALLEQGIEWRALNRPGNRDLAQLIQEAQGLVGMAAASAEESRPEP